MAHPLNRPRLDPALRPRRRGLRHPAAPGHAGAADRRRRLAVPARLLQRRPASTPTRPPSRTSTRICSAKAPTPAKASTTSTPSRLRSPAACRSRGCSATISSRAFSRAPASRPTSRWSRIFPPATMSRRCAHHRWARGDWQLLPWMLGADPQSDRGHGGVPTIGRWKMLDNLRRSLSAPSRSPRCWRDGCAGRRRRRSGPSSCWPPWRCPRCCP